MNRIKRISSELLQKYPDKFSLEFDTNKKTLNELAIVKSKVLRNEIAGYITAHLRKQAAREKASITAAVGDLEDEGDETEEKSEQSIE
jgi:small subunit ribosomal protein S17e